MSTTLPEKGLYTSTKLATDMRFVVEDVISTDDDFYLVHVVDEASKDDMSAMSDEFDNEEWQALVDKFGLIYSGMTV
jgi:hypothetical protein